MLPQCAENSCSGFCFDPYSVLQILVAAFLAIVFIQSGWDKVSDRKGNLGWMITHFGKSVLKDSVRLLFPVLTVMEVASGIANFTAIILIFFTDPAAWFFWGSVSASVTFLSLFFGQRVAKDYAGAQSLTGYFIVSLIGVWLCT